MASSNHQAICVRIQKNKKPYNLCKSAFTIENYKVKDHDHLSGRFRQTLCNNCNMKLKTPNFILHNLSHYDARVILYELGYDERTIAVIPNSKKKFLSFSKYIINKFTVWFIYTFRFMASNLLSDDFSKFRETSRIFPTEVYATRDAEGDIPVRVYR